MKMSVVVGAAWCVAGCSLVGCASRVAVPSASPRVETEPVRTSGDAADDIAVWVNPSDPSRSVLIGTDKRRGLVVYDLRGRLVQEVEGAGINNVDVLTGVPVGDAFIDVAAGSSRDGNSVALFAIDAASGRLRDVAARVIAVDGGAVYGLCAGRGPSGACYVFVTTVDDEVHQFRLAARGDRVDGELVRRFSVGGHAEGMVVDTAQNALFVAEEDVGIWRYEAEPGWLLTGKPAGHPEMSASEAGPRVMVGLVGRDGLAADIEGLAIYPFQGGGGVLLASNQGDDTFAAFERLPPHRMLGRFRIGGAGSIDGVSGTDGIEACAAALGAAYPAGVFVAQDDRNDGGNQNFKVVDWREVARALGVRRSP